MKISPTHTCPARNCTLKVAFEELACKRHWRKLPWRMRTNLTQAFRRGDRVAHQEALEAALAFYATHDVDDLGESGGGFTSTTLDAS